MHKSKESIVDEYRGIISRYPSEKVDCFKRILSGTEGLTDDTFFFFRNLAIFCLYVLDNKSAYQIKDEFPEIFLNKNYTFLTSRGILSILKKFGFVRSHSKAMGLRVKLGRMDYEKRKFDYVKRSEDQYKNWVFANKLLKVLRKKNISEDLLAKRIKANRRTIYEWRTCRSRVSPKKQRKLIRALQVDFDDLFTKNNVRYVGSNPSLRKKGYLIKNLDIYLRKNNLTKEDLARMTGVTGYIVTNWKQRRTFLSKNLANKIAEILDVKFKNIFDFDYMIPRAACLGTKNRSKR